MLPTKPLKGLALPFRPLMGETKLTKLCWQCIEPVSKCFRVVVEKVEEASPPSSRSVQVSLEGLLRES